MLTSTSLTCYNNKQQVERRALLALLVLWWVTGRIVVCLNKPPGYYLSAKEQLGQLWIWKYLRSAQQGFELNVSDDIQMFSR